MIKCTGSDNDEDASLVQPLDGGWVVEKLVTTIEAKLRIRTSSPSISDR